MRIALSGSHQTGKSTLLGELAELLPGYAAVGEPYEILEEEGYQFAHPPSLADHEAQLERSLELLLQPGKDVVFERCPLDFVAYALASPDAELFETSTWLGRIRAAMATLSFVVFVPVEAPDRVALDDDGEAALRLEVDEKLREILVEDAFDLDLDVLEVSGSPGQRAALVISRVRGREAAPR